MNFPWGHPKRYNDFGSYIRHKLNGRVQKISINAGFTCPNRDGSKGTGGCTFCNNDSFKPSYCEPVMRIKEQIEKGISVFQQRHPESKYLAYFQSYTNTYGSIDLLVDLYEQALACEGVAGLIIGTRPDCLPDDLLDYFEELQKRTYVTVELGVESTSNATLDLVNRGHGIEETKDALMRLSAHKIPAGAHLILGLPGETRAQMLNHAVELSKLPINYLKIHQLQYIKGSKLGSAYQSNPSDFEVFELNDYIELVVDFLELLSPQIVMERFASQAPHDLLIAPRWGFKNFELVRMVEKRLEERDTWQGRLFI
jgi:radical SAM protein (TIGR01212 family)